jgi:hypothetical protein
MVLHKWVPFESKIESNACANYTSKQIKQFVGFSRVWLYLMFIFYTLTNMGDRLRLKLYGRLIVL